MDDKGQVAEAIRCYHTSCELGYEASRDALRVALTERGLVCKRDEMRPTEFSTDGPPQFPGMGVTDDGDDEGSVASGGSWLVDGMSQNEGDSDLDQLESGSATGSSTLSAGSTSFWSTASREEESTGAAGAAAHRKKSGKPPENCEVC